MQPRTGHGYFTGRSAAAAISRGSTPARRGEHINSGNLRPGRQLTIEATVSL
jgi:hypothetical protein